MNVCTRITAMLLPLSFAAPLLAGFAGTDLFLPNVGRQAGIFPSDWYTTVWLYNPGAEAVTAKLYFLQRNTANLTPPSVDVLVPPGDTLELDNAVESLFHLQAFGALRITAPDKLVVSSRTYSKGSGESDSVGQDFAGVPAAFAIGAGESAQILGVHQVEPAASSAYRFNYGFVETTGHRATVRVTVLDETGAQQGTEDLEVREFSQRQVAFKDHFPSVSTENARLEVEVVSGSGRVIAYGSGIANASQDPTTFEMSYKDSLLGSAGVQHDATLTGDGTAAAPLGVTPGSLTSGSLATGAVTSTQLADAAVTFGKIAASNAPSSGPASEVSAQAAGTPSVLIALGGTLFWQPAPAGDITSVTAGTGLTGGATSGDAALAIATGGVGTTQIADGAVTAGKVAAGQVVTGLNGLKDAVTLQAGANTTITPIGNTLTISSDGLLLPYSAGTSSANSAFSVANTGTGNALNASSKAYGLFAVSTGSGTGSQGVRGETTSSAGFGVVGYASAGSGSAVGVYGQSDSPGGHGVGGYSPGGAGTVGVSVSGIGVQGVSTTGEAGHFDGAVQVAGPLTVTGALNLPSGQLVKSINGLKDAVTLQAGANTTITANGNTLVVGSNGLTLPFSYGTNYGQSLFAVTNGGSGGAISGSGVLGAGVSGNSTGGAGVVGQGQTMGVAAWSTSGHAIDASSQSGFAGFFYGTKTYIEKLGVGTTNPLAPLHVGGGAVLGSGTAFYFGQCCTGAGISTVSPNGSWLTGLLVDDDIVGQRSIVSTQNVTASDARIKNVIGPSDGAADLATLEKLQVADYTYKDTVRMGSRPQKKVIAQQVEQVYPQAVRQRREFVPDVYAMADVTESGGELILTLEKPHGLHQGDTVKLIDAHDGESSHTVLRVPDERTFTITAGDAPPPDRLFVYGRQVDDFRVVDYEALAMLNVSATQELVRKLGDLSDRVTRLEAALAAAPRR